jgi:hypothetical protein
MKGHFLVLTLLLAAAPAASAQGLGDAAARERHKRQQQPPPPAPPKVFTDADLAKRPPADDADQDASPGAKDAGSSRATAGKKPDEKPDEKNGEDELERERQERKLLEAEWRVRFADAREQLAQAEAACWHEVVRTEFHQGIPVQMKVKEFVASEEYRQAKQALADLEEQFRRTGLPPGWARER